MLLDKSQHKWYLPFILVFLTVSIIAGAQTQQKRVPGKIIPAEYSGILLMESRIELEQPDKVIQFMGPKDGDIVADIGCGNGFFSLRVANEIAPRGVVFAVDVQQGMLDQLIERQKEASISNIYPILGKFEDPMLPPGKVDWILLVDAYHEFSNPEPMLARIKESLAPGGRIALVEYRGEPDPKSKFPMPKDHTMTFEQIMGEWPPAGFELVTSVEFLPIQHLFVFKNADDNTRPIIRTINIENTPNVSTFDHQIYFSGQPHQEAFRQFADFGVKTVINLSSAQEAAGLGFDEKAAIEEAGMAYMHIPMNHEIPDASSLQKIRGALETARDTHVLLHCADSNRVGAIWALYAGQKDNLPIDKAIAEGKTAGMKAPALEAAVREVLSRD